MECNSGCGDVTNISRGDDEAGFLERSSHEAGTLQGLSQRGNTRLVRISDVVILGHDHDMFASFHVDLFDATVIEEERSVDVVQPFTAGKQSGKGLPANGSMRAGFVRR